MKTRDAVLAVSLLLNVALAGVLLTVRPEPPSLANQPAPAPRRSDATTKLSADSPPTPAAVVPELLRQAGPAKPDFVQLHADLVTAGLSSKLRWEIIEELMEDYLERRQMEAGLRPKPGEYWRNEVNAHTATPAQREMVRALEQEADALSRLLDQMKVTDREAERFQGLPPEKANRLAEILSDYREMEEQVGRENTGSEPEVVRAKRKLLQQEKRADIARLLTPQELEMYELRNSDNAHWLRARLGGYQVTENEFRSLYAVVNAAFETRGEPTRDDAADAEIRSVLGESRFAELLEANDHSLHWTRDFLASKNLPATLATQLVALQRETRARTLAVQRNRDLTTNEREAQLNALGLEARSKVEQLLGPAALDFSRHRAGAMWLPPPRQPPAGK